MKIPAKNYCFGTVRLSTKGLESQNSKKAHLTSTRSAYETVFQLDLERRYMGKKLKILKKLLNNHLLGTEREEHW